MLEYVVTTEDGVFVVPGDKFEDPGMAVGDIYTPDNCGWFDDIVFGLSDHVPGDGDFLSVEVR